MAKSESVHQAEGQATALGSNLNYSGHHHEDWLEVKDEENEEWQANMTKFDSYIH